MHLSLPISVLALLGHAAAQYNAPCYETSAYEVVSGDSLSAIAAAHGITTSQIEYVNDNITNYNLIYPGQYVIIPNTNCVVETTPLPASCVGTETYTVQSGDTLYDIAMANGITVNQLEASNPQITNPDLIYPQELIAISPSTCAPASSSKVRRGGKCVGVSTYKVKSGDYLYAIAQAHGVTLDQLEAANPQIKDFNVIHPGDIINIPSPSCVPPPPASTTTTTSSTPVSTPGYCTGVSTYTVKSGDTLSAIAKAEGVSLAQLEAANTQIKNPNVIYPGESVNVPLPNCIVPPSSTTTTTTSTPTTSPGPCTGISTYKVVKGDTLYGIASDNGLTLAQIEAANPQIPNFNIIYPDEIINIPATNCIVPPSSTTTTTSSTATGTCHPTAASTYKVKSGDTLYDIAIAHGFTLDSVEAVNPQIPNFNEIYPGEVINLPSCNLPASTSTTTSAGPTATCASSHKKSYKVKSGDTLTSIANAEGITLQALEDANPQIPNFNVIYPDEKIHIPICHVSATTLSTSFTAQATPSHKKDCVESGPTEYTVKSGDTLSSIAKGYGVSTHAFEKANPQLKDYNVITPGELLHVPRCGFKFVLGNEARDC